MDGGDGGRRAAAFHPGHSWSFWNVQRRWGSHLPLWLPRPHWMCTGLTSHSPVSSTSTVSPEGHDWPHSADGDLPRLWITCNLVPIHGPSPEKDIPSKCRETIMGSLTNKTENVHTQLVVPSMVLACSASRGEVGFHLWGPLTNPGLPLYDAHICSHKT